MAIRDSFLMELDRESQTTRRVLERLPEDRWEFKPHAKSFAMNTLATHLTQILMWMKWTIDVDELDLAPKDGPAFPSPAPVRDRAELLSSFDTKLAEAKAALAIVTDEQMMKTWKLMVTGETKLSMPRVAALRFFVFNHMVHHRAQLGLYLRLLDQPVPSMYGPTADEQPF